MKITGFEVLRVPPSWVWLTLHTDEGITGLGEPYLEGHPEAVIAETQRLAALLVGEDFRHVEALWRKLYEDQFYYRGGPVKMSALSGIDMALWDLKGKELGRPVSELLGGPVTDRVMVYSGSGRVPVQHPEPGAQRVNHNGFGPPQGLRGEAREWGDTARWVVQTLGFRALKLHFPLGGGPSVLRQVDTAVGIVDEVRRQVGPDIPLGIDLHHTYFPAALTLAREFMPYRIAYLEDPQQPEHFDGLRDICARTEIPIAAGAAWMGKWAFRQALDAGVAIVQPDLCHAGGITECKKIAALAEAHDRHVALHTPNSIIQFAASLQLHAAIPNQFMQEHSASVRSFADGKLLFGVGYLKEPITLEADGCVRVPSLPGLGIELDNNGLDEIRRRPWHGVAFR